MPCCWRCSLPRPHRQQRRSTRLRTAASRSRRAPTAGPYRLKATALAQYLLYSKDKQFLTADGLAAEPSEAAEWRASEAGGNRRARVARGRRQADARGPYERLRRVPRDRAERQRRAVEGAVHLRRGPRPDGGAHPRDGVRVPRRVGALRPAMAPVRRAVCARGLPRPRGDERLRRGPRDRARGEHLPRPVGLAEVRRAGRTTRS